MRGFCFYRPVPEPGPDGLRVDPLREELGPTVLPDRFMFVPEPLAEPGVLRRILCRDASQIAPAAANPEA
jgi:hypothetical protein